MRMTVGSRKRAPEPAAEGSPAAVLPQRRRRRLTNGLRHAIGVSRRRSLYGDALNILFLGLLSVLMIIPMLYVVSNSLKPLNELYLYPPRFFVQHPTLDNFRDLVTLMSNTWVPMSRYFFNTIFITVVGTALHVIFASMAAYVLEKHRFHGRELFFTTVTLALLFSSTVTMIPNYIILSKLKLIDTYGAVLLSAVGSPMGAFLMKQFMSNVHDSLLEAAKIDGAGEVRIFFRIVMPSVKPAWLTLIIFSVQTLWNSNGGIAIRSEELKPLSYALSQIAAGGIARAGAAAAVSVVMMIVPIAVFIITQSNILETMAMSGIKE